MDKIIRLSATGYRRLPTDDEQLQFGAQLDVTRWPSIMEKAGAIWARRMDCATITHSGRSTMFEVP